jgi:hypothetical protein
MFSFSIPGQLSGPPNFRQTTANIGSNGKLPLKRLKKGSWLKLNGVCNLLLYIVKKKKGYAQ